MHLNALIVVYVTRLTLSLALSISEVTISEVTREDIDIRKYEYLKFFLLDKTKHTFVFNRYVSIVYFY